MTDTMNDLFVTEVFLCMDDIVYDFSEGKMEKSAFLLEYEKYRRMLRLLESQGKLGLELKSGSWFDWKGLYERGHLCKHDFVMFEEELKKAGVAYE